MVAIAVPTKGILLAISAPLSAIWSKHFNDTSAIKSTLSVQLDLALSEP